MPLNVDKLSTGTLSVNGTEITPSAPPSYKVYTALLTQSGTNPPTAQVLENTIGDVNWSYGNTGEYFIGSGAAPFVGTVPAITQVFGVELSDSVNYLTMEKMSDNSLRIKSFNNLPTPINDVLSNTFIEIRVYN